MTEPVTIYEAGARSTPHPILVIRELWKVRSLAWAMAAADIRATHQDTWIGRGWAVLDPLLLGLTYFFLFAVVLGKTTDPSYLAFLLGGVFAYNFTRRAIQAGATSVVKGGAYLTATRTPRALLPIAVVLAALQVYVPTLLAYLPFYLVGGYRPTWPLILVPLLIALQTVLNLGIVFLAATATAFFRDVSAFIPYVLRIVMYVSPVLYTVSDLSGRFRWVLALNPLTPLFTSWQTVLFEGTWPSTVDLLAATVWAVGLLAVGGWIFLRREREFALLV